MVLLLNLFEAVRIYVSILPLNNTNTGPDTNGDCFRKTVAIS